MKTLLDMLDLAISENYDDRIDAANDLKDIIEERVSGNIRKKLFIKLLKNY